MGDEANFEEALDAAVEAAGGPGNPPGPNLLVKKDEAVAEANASPQAADAEAKAATAAVSMLPLHPESFRDNALAILTEELKQWHGPAQYLWAHYKTPEARAQFADALDLAFPARPELQYHRDPELPNELTSTFPVRLSDLGFSQESSSKPPPFMHISVQLLDEYLTNTVQTEHDELLLAQGPTDGEKNFWTRFVKGSARTCTLLFLASQALAREWNLAVLAPDLLHSMTAVYCKRGIMTTDFQSVALENAKLSQKGSIRRAHCVLTWLGKLNLLQQKGLNPDQVIKTWNQRATQAGQLTGNKRVAVLQLLGLPRSCANVLLQHLSEFGDQTAFLEDAFSNKRLAIGAKARTGSQVWNNRLQVTEEGLLMMLQYVHTQHLKKLPGTHQKLRKEALEEFLNMSQLLVALAAELVSHHPIQQSVLDENVSCL